MITEAVIRLYDRIINPALLVRRLYLNANNLIPEAEMKQDIVWEQLELFTDYSAIEEERKENTVLLEREKKLQQTMLDIKKKYGKNAILKGMNLLDGATAKDRNNQIGGHKA